MSDDRIGCSAGCKRTIADMDEGLALAWECLPITGRWRCPDCTAELHAASYITGTQAVPPEQDKPV